MKTLSFFVFTLMLLVFQSQGLAAPEQGGDSRARPERPPGAAGSDQARRQDDSRQREGERRPPKLSPEERKALRQQIHEVGHDLYPAKR